MTTLTPEVLVRPTLKRSGTRPTPSYRFELIASVLVSAALVPFLVNAQLTWAFILPFCVLCALATQKGLGLIIRPKKLDLFDPSTLVAGYFVTYFALRALYLVTTPFVDRLGRNAYDDYLPIALWCACLGYAAVLAGSHSKLAARLLPACKISWPRAVPVARIWILLILGLLALIYLFKIGIVVGNFGSRAFQRDPPPGLPILLGNLPSLCLIAICVCLTLPGRIENRTAAWPALAGCISIIVLDIALSGGKEALIKPLLESLIVLHYLKRRFKIWELAAIGLPTLFLAFGVINFYRFVVVGQNGSPKSLGDVISRVSSASSLLASSARGASEPSAYQQMLDRDAGIDALALIVKYTPQPYAYQYGVSVLRLPLTLIPRALWHNKPIELQSADFESTYMAEPASFNGFSSMHLISDFYRNFGILGLACGMFLFGVSLRFLYLFCSPSPANPAGVFFYAAVLPQLVHFLEMDMESVLNALFRLMLLLIVVAAVLRFRYQSLRVGNS